MVVDKLYIYGNLKEKRVISLLISKFFVYLQHRLASPAMGGSGLIGKKDVYGRFLWCSNLANLTNSQKKRNGASTLGVLLKQQYIMAWANSSCLSLGIGNARA